MTNLRKEIWKETNESPNYQVSNKGNLRRLVKGKWQLLISNSKSYRYIHINGKSLAVHRLVAIAFIDNSDNKPEVNHINGIRSDNRVKNLEWCTRRENEKHAYEIGLAYSHPGEKCGRSKLTDKQVTEIRKLYLQKNIPLWFLCEIYKMGQTAMSDIVNYRTFKHLRKIKKIKPLSQFRYSKNSWRHKAMLYSQL